jgi:hypothetical protein
MPRGMLRCCANLEPSHSARTVIGAENTLDPAIATLLTKKYNYRVRRYSGSISNPARQHSGYQLKEWARKLFKR